MLEELRRVVAPGRGRAYREAMRKLVALVGILTAGLLVASPAVVQRVVERVDADTAAGGTGRGGRDGSCGKSQRGYQVIFDGSRECFQRWRYAGGSSVTLQRDGTLRAAPGAPNLGVLWYAARPYGDFSLRLQFRDDSPIPGTRANSGVQVRFPAPRPPVPGCPMTFNGTPQTENPAAWIAVNCGHEIQINDSPEAPGNDPRKTGFIYGFADLDSVRSRPTPAGVWNDLEIRVVGSRALVGYIGLQAHGAPQDVVSFRDIRIHDLSNRD